jgi:hypothetical protein
VIHEALKVKEELEEPGNTCVFSAPISGKYPTPRKFLTAPILESQSVLHLLSLAAYSF